MGDHATFHPVVSFASLRPHESIFPWRLQLSRFPFRWPRDLEREEAATTFPFFRLLFFPFFSWVSRYRIICKCSVTTALSVSLSERYRKCKWHLKLAFEDSVLCARTISEINKANLKPMYTSSELFSELDIFHIATHLFQRHFVHKSSRKIYIIIHHKKNIARCVCTC